MLSKLTLIGMHEYSDGDIWANLVLPEGVDKDIFINECLRQGGEFSLLYPNQEFLKMQIGEFGRKWYHNFERWWKAYYFEYEALYNLDVTFTRNEKGDNTSRRDSYSNSTQNGSTVGTGSEQRNESNSLSGNTSESGSSSTSGEVSTSGSNSDTKSKAAYDSNTMVAVESTEGSNSMTSEDSHTTEDSKTGSKSEYGSSSGRSSNSKQEESRLNGTERTEDNENSNHNIEVTEVRRGNYGMTMSQELLLAEYNAWSLNVYAHMAEVFVSEFCICIYM